jgi:8-amino-7-oxononanoate synthase
LYIYQPNLFGHKDMNEDFLSKKLRQRQESFSFRELRLPTGGIDFCSNDYLGIVKNRLLDLSPEGGSDKWSGSTGSRLITGNYELIEQTEKLIAKFHNTPAALIFNSGYDANLGLLGAVLQRHDTVLYDQLSHASIRDGIRLSHAFSFSYAHNDMDDLERRLQSATGNVFVVTESVFSMDGDIAPLREIAELCETYDAFLIVDEAHATGVFGKVGEGVVQHLDLQEKVFARVHTFGKALGCHGAAVVGSENLRQYLINFCRPFIYSTAMPASAVMAIHKAYELLPTLHQERSHLKELVSQFQEHRNEINVCRSISPIQGIIVPGNENVKRAAARIQEEGIDVRPILYPTVPRDLERLRIVLHSFNSSHELVKLIGVLKELR